LLLSPRGAALRREAERCVTAALAGEVGSAPWRKLLAGAEAAGTDVEEDARALLEEEAKSGMKRTAKDIADESKRSGRRRRTEILDLGLELCAHWLRDLAALAAGAEEVVFNRDRLDVLRAQAAGLDPGKARQGAELAQETRRSLDLNVSEELALEALFFRLERLLG
jgi:DNA polymerase-3 subunit delta'